MAIIRKKDLSKMSKSEMIEKIKELRLELVKSQVSSKKASSKITEIKRTIARLLTFSKSKSEELK